jgi:3,4-dihydroxy 2-butanone 4-phosphate synthase/GTP cyclohydrolase II
MLDYRKFISSSEEIINDAKLGKMFILVDDENRENEGDLIIPAEFVTPENINFMIKNCSGIICLSMSQSKANTLGINPMVQDNKSAYSTPFGVSIEAKTGITTGVSAADRTSTIIAATKTNATKDDIVSPGHIFPLIAKDGGVLVREGHTESSVDVCTLAGLSGCAAICEIMNTDGTISKMEELVEFSKKHNIKIGTIADLISYRRKRERFLSRISETSLEDGIKIVTFREKENQLEHFAILQGDASKALVRLQAFNLFDEISGNGTFNILNSLKKQHPNLVIILINNGKNWKSSEFEIKEYGKGAEILQDLGFEKIKLLTRVKGRHFKSLSGFGIEIEEEILI